MRTTGARGTLAPVRARQPERCGYAVRDGVRLYYEVFGDGPTTVLLLPAWSIVHSRIWKLQVPYLARQFRVVTFDPRGNGRSDRPRGGSAYDDEELVADTLAVMDEVGIDAAVCVGLSYGGRVLVELAARSPERVLGALFVAAALGFDPLAVPILDAFEDPLAPDQDVAGTWWSYNADYWRRDLRGFADFFFGQVFPESHSTRQIDSSVEWAMETDAETLVATRSPARSVWGPERLIDRAREIRCPALVVHGELDIIQSIENGERLAAALGAPLMVFEQCGHGIQGRHPVRFNLLVREFAESVARPVVEVGDALTRA
jgi:pimeloyl-ACP methyl ester carboxylesterase